MRYAPAAAVLALAALFAPGVTGPAAAQNQPVPQSPAKEIIESPQAAQPAPGQAAPPAQQGAPVQPSHPQPEATPRAGAATASPPQGNALAGPEQQEQGERAVQSKSGQGGKQEPSATTPMRHGGPVLVDGRLNVPGAPADSQTVPAKFSKANDALDKRPIMAFPLALSGEQRTTLLAAIRAAAPDTPVERIDPKLTEELPVTVKLHDLPIAANEMGVGHYKYVRLSDRIVLVTPANRIVVAEIKG